MAKRKSIKPGRMFWVGTFAVGVFSPGKGKRRVSDRMNFVDAQWKAAQARIRALEDELATAYGELERRPLEAPLRKCLGGIAECDEHRDREETVQLPLVDPDVIHVRHLAEVPGAGDFLLPLIQPGK